MNPLQESAWLAGILDAEGYFGHDGNRAVVELLMSDLDVVEKAVNIMSSSTKIETKPDNRAAHYKTCYRTRWYRGNAENLMQRVLPYMADQRRTRIESVLNLAETRVFDLSDEQKNPWLAGLLDGDGCFAVTAPKRVNTRKMLVVSLMGCDKSLLEKAKTVVETKATIRERGKEGNPRRRPRYGLRWNGKEAENIMQRVSPYVGVRRLRKIEECLRTENLSHHTRI